MSRAARVWLSLSLACGSAAGVAAQAPPPRYGLGRPATSEEIQARDIDVMPDGRGLPPGRGTVREGATVYAAQCASCHGAKGEGGSAERLVGRNDGDSFDYANNPKLVRTIGSYWPYATTLFDYTRRAMPFQRPGTLTAEDTYGLVAYLLFLNGVVPEDTVMDAGSLPKVVMPARGRFVPDDRMGSKRVK
jgi:cytochrome c